MRDVLLPHAQRDQFAGGGEAPVGAVGLGTGGAGMQNLADADSRALGGGLGTFTGEGTDADEPFGLEDCEQLAEMLIAGGAEALAFGRGKLVRGDIASAFVAEGERAIVGDEMFAEKSVRRAEATGEEFPQAAATDFRAGAGKAGDRPFRVRLGRLRHGGGDTQPIARGGDLAEGNTSLDHPEGTRVHPQKNHALGRMPKAAEVFLVRGPSVCERIVNVRNGRAKPQPANVVGELTRGGDQSGAVGG